MDNRTTNQNLPKSRTLYSSPPIVTNGEVAKNAVNNNAVAIPEEKEEERARRNIQKSRTIHHHNQSNTSIAIAAPIDDPSMDLPPLAPASLIIVKEDIQDIECNREVNREQTANSSDEENPKSTSKRNGCSSFMERFLFKPIHPQCKHILSYGCLLLQILILSVIFIGLSKLNTKRPTSAKISTIHNFPSPNPSDPTLKKSSSPSSSPSLDPTMKPTFKRNVALGRLATQSSTFDENGLPNNAIDGNTIGIYGAAHGRSVTHTKKERNPWWKVNLQDEYIVSSVRIWNREDCCSDELDNVVISLHDKNDKVKVSRSHDGSVAAGGMVEFTFDNVICSQVQVSLIGDLRTLSLAEVEVFGVLSNK